jgi:hypothetical protein
MTLLKKPLTIPEILSWADDHRRRFGNYPSAASGPVLAKPVETWGGINAALNHALRGLAGGDSLSALLKRERGHKTSRGRPPKLPQEHTRLLHGPYRHPGVHVGTRTTCLLRGEVVVTSRTEGRMRWPRCLPIGKRGKPTLLMTEELARAIRSESAAAVKWWWGAGVKQIWTWRKALGVSRTNNEGTRRLIHAASQKGADAMKEREWSEKEREKRRQQTIASGCNTNIKPGYNLGPLWSAEELALLGTMPDEDLAKQLGRTKEAVRVQRTRLGIATARDRRRQQG